MIASTDFLTTLDANLCGNRMRVSRQVELPGGPVAALFGSRTYFSWKGLVLVSQHVTVRTFEGQGATPEDAEDLFEAAFRQAKRVNRVPLLRGMQFGYVVITCLVVADATRALVDYAKRRPRKHWALCEFPVVLDRGTGRLHYYDKTAFWGSLFLSDARDMVERCFVPAISSAEPLDNNN